MANHNRIRERSVDSLPHLNGLHRSVFDLKDWSRNRHSALENLAASLAARHDHLRQQVESRAIFLPQSFAKARFQDVESKPETLISVA
jgi:hypothetical protein